MRVTVLGCGGSGGVPVAGRQAGGYWGACDPTNPKNRRRRVSILVESEGKVLLIDTSPDLRLQLLDAGVTRIDAVLYTHAHGDHSHGLDDLRAIVYDRRAPIDAYMDAGTRDALTRQFAYAFTSSCDPEDLYMPLLADRAIDGPFRAAGLDVRPFPQGHGGQGHGEQTTLGFRIGAMAYSTDVVALEEAAFRTLEGVELWIVDCLRDAPHPTHSHVAQTLDWIARVAPRRALLTHMNHSLDHDELAARCPPGVEPAHDGLAMELE